MPDSTGKFVLLAYDNKTGACIRSTGSLPGKSCCNHYRILSFFNWWSIDILELDSRVVEKVKGK